MIKFEEELPEGFKYTPIYPDHLERVDVRPGDLFVMTVPNSIPDEIAHRYREAWKDLFEHKGEPVPKLIILCDGMKLGVIRREDIEK